MDIFFCIKKESDGMWGATLRTEGGTIWTSTIRHSSSIGALDQIENLCRWCYKDMVVGGKVDVQDLTNQAVVELEVKE